MKLQEVTIFKIDQDQLKSELDKYIALAKKCSGRV